MKRISLFRACRWFKIVALLATTLSGSAQTWIQWSSAAGGNNHYYALTPYATNWIAAERLAVSWGGTLATITSSSEQDFVNTTFLTGTMEHLPLWIGLFDPSDPSAGGALSAKWEQLKELFGVRPKNRFRWVTGEPFSYTNWKPGEPSNSSPGEYYVAINWEYSDEPPRGVKGDWNDTPLDGTARYGGKTSGPYFGLVERETDPNHPPKWWSSMPGSLFVLIAVVAAMLVLWWVRSRRQRRTEV